MNKYSEGEHACSQEPKTIISSVSYLSGGLEGGALGIDKLCCDVCGNGGG